MTGRVLTAAFLLLLGLATVVYAQGGLPKRQVSHGVVTSWENAEGRGCAYVRMAGRWYSTRIVPALDGFATLHAIRDSNRRKTPIMFSVLPPITECGPLPGIRVWTAPSSPRQRR